MFLRGDTYCLITPQGAFLRLFYHLLHPPNHRHLEQIVIGRGLEPKVDEVNAPKGQKAVSPGQRPGYKHVYENHALEGQKLCVLVLLPL